MRRNAVVKYVPALLVAGAVLFLSPSSFAGGLSPYAIRGDKAFVLAGTGPDSTAHFGCELRAWSSTGIPCYGPDAIRKAYGLYHLIKSGNDGAGQTIVIIDAYGSPTVESDLAAFDSVFAVPPPPSFQEIRMAGTTPFDYTDFNQLGWAEETSLDVQWAHAIAPGAKIVLVVAATNSDADILAAQNYAIDHRLGFIISESFGESELALQQDGAEGAQILSDNEKSYRRARRHHISVLVSAGDSGAAGGDIDGNLQPVPVAQLPGLLAQRDDRRRHEPLLRHADERRPERHLPGRAGLERRLRRGRRRHQQGLPPPRLPGGLSAPGRPARCSRGTAATLTWPTTAASTAA